MTTRDFIAKQFGNADGQSKWCSSVLKDGQGNLYSYGYHYPLLFTVAGQTYRNTRGYSATTGRHVAWAGQAVNYQTIDVELTDYDPHAFRVATDAEKLAIIHKCQQATIRRAAAKLEAKKRKDTQVAEYLRGRLYDAKTAYALAGGK